MPIITAQRRSPCTVCRLTIERGERVDYTLATGARHIACAEQGSTMRRNVYATACELCSHELKPGHAELEVSETEPAPGVFERKWHARCVDVVACDRRIRGEHG